MFFSFQLLAVDQDDEGNQEVPNQAFRHGFLFYPSEPAASPGTPTTQQPSSSRPPTSPTITVPAFPSLPAPAPTDHNWQAARGSVRERNAIMFHNELMADVYFVVGAGDSQRRVPAHKYVLATGSSVFYAMFYGGLAEDKKEVVIPDVEPQAFLNLLK